jgi:hypothetical protein
VLRHRETGQEAKSALTDFLFCLRNFQISMFDVLAHSLIFGSVQYLHASYIYVLCFAPPPPLLELCSLLEYFSFLFSSAPFCAIYLEGY